MHRHGKLHTFLYLMTMWSNCQSHHLSQFKLTVCESLTSHQLLTLVSGWGSALEMSSNSKQQYNNLSLKEISLSCIANSEMKQADRRRLGKLEGRLDQLLIWLSSDVPLGLWAWPPAHGCVRPEKATNWPALPRECGRGQGTLKPRKPLWLH